MGIFQVSLGISHETDILLPTNIGTASAEEPFRSSHFLPHLFSLSSHSSPLTCLTRFLPPRSASSHLLSSFLGLISLLTSTLNHSLLLSCILFLFSSPLSSISSSLFRRTASEQKPLHSNHLLDCLFSLFNSRLFPYFSFSLSSFLTFYLLSPLFSTAFLFFLSLSCTIH